MVSVARKALVQPAELDFWPVWTTLYVLIGSAGARTWLAEGLSLRMKIWLAQMVLNFLWSPAFFGLHSTGLGLVVILPMLAAIIAFIARSWRRDRVSALLFLPYVAWVGFATLLNLSLFILN